MSAETNMTEQAVDPEARSMAAQAMQLMQSHDRLDEERWKENNRRFDEAGRSIQRQFDELRQSIVTLRSEISGTLSTITVKLDGIDRTYSARWWSLAVGMILALLGLTGFLAVKALVFHA